MPSKRGKSNPRRASQIYASDDDESNASTATPVTGNILSDEKEHYSDASTADNSPDDTSPGSLAKDIEIAEKDLEEFGVSVNQHDAADNHNPHSAQAKLNQALNPKSSENRLAQLTAAAAEKAAQRKERAIKKRAKRCEKEAKGALQKKKQAHARKSNKSKSKSSKNSDSDSSSDDSNSSSSSSSSSSDSEEYGKKRKATKTSKTKNKSSHNTFAILNSAPSTKMTQKARLSKAARKKDKKMKRDQRTFFCAKISVKASNNPMEELLRQTKAWFDEFRSIDSTAIIYAYKDKKTSSALSSASDIPDSLTPFRNYFNNASLRNTAGHVWLNMYIVHTLHNEKILKQMKEYRDRTDSWTFIKKTPNTFHFTRIFSVVVN